MTRKGSFYAFLIVLISISLTFLIYRGTGYSAGNEILSYLLRMIDPTYLQNDWFINSVQNTSSVRSIFVGILYSLNLFINDLSLTFLIVYFLSILMAASSAYLIALHLFKNTKVATLSSFVTLCGTPFMLGDSLFVPRFLIASGLAVSLILAGFYFLLKKKLIIFAILMGIATMIHFLWGGLLFFVFLSASFITSINKKKDKIYSIKNHLFSLLIFLLVSSIALYPLILSQAQSDPLSGKEVAEILGGLKAHHYMPSSWEWYEYLNFLLFLVVFVIALRDSMTGEKERSLVFAIISILFVLFLTYTVFSEIIPVGLIIKMHFFRLSGFIAFIGSIFIIEHVCNNSKMSLEEQNLKFLVYFLLAASLLVSHVSLIIFPLFIIFKIVEKNKNIDRIILGTIFISFLIIFLFLTPLNHVISSKLSENYSPIMKVIILIPLFVFTLKDNRITKILLVIFLILISAWFFITNDSKLVYQFDGPTAELYQFVTANTPKDAIFLIPPALSSFRNGAKRAVVVDLQNALFEDDALAEWFRRIKDISGNPALETNRANDEAISTGYSLQKEERLLDLKKKYNFSYAVFEKPKKLDLGLKYENEKYVVYNV